MKLKKPSFKFTYSIFNADFSPDSTILATIGNPIKLWNVKERRKVGTIQTISNASHIVISKNSKFIAIKNTTGYIAIHNLNDGFSKVLQGVGTVGCDGSNILLTQDNLKIVDCSWHGEIIVIDIKTGKSVFNETIPDGGISQIGFSKEQNTYYFLSYDKFYFIDSKFKNKIEKIKFKEISEINHFDINSQGNLIAIIGKNSLLDEKNELQSFCLSIYDLNKRELINCIQTKNYSFRKVGWHKSGKIIAVSENNYVTLFEFPYLKEIAKIEIDRFAYHVKFSPDGKFILIGGSSKGSMLLDLKTINFNNNFDITSCL